MSHNDVAIKTTNLSKIFRLYKTPFEALRELIFRSQRHSKFVALNEVNLTLQRGEIVGILGRNGAGKSTLLKIIAGTLEKTSGQLEVNGRITALLELGTGFHPDYTGRENIFMGGLCLGMTRQEIESKLDSIIDFSELRDVIDQPFKTYSTGMQARLTFSTAISVDPDILIVDEALSVGDARFQMKCFAWMQKLKEKKTTVLLVSHDTNTITTVCDRAIILEKGCVYAEGEVKQITTLYQNLLFGERSKSSGPSAQVESVENTNDKTSKMRYGTGQAKMTDWSLVDENHNPISVIESGEPFSFNMKFVCNAAIPDLTYGLAIKDRRGTVLWGMTNISQGLGPRECFQGEQVSISLDGVMWLAAGDYFITFGLACFEDGTKVDFIEDGIDFKVTGPGAIFTTSFVNLQATMREEPVDAIDIKRTAV